MENSVLLLLIVAGVGFMLMNQNSEEPQRAETEIAESEVSSFTKRNIVFYFTTTISTIRCSISALWRVVSDITLRHMSSIVSEVLVFSIPVSGSAA